MESAYEAIEVAKKTGQIRRGINEVTKALERGTAKFVAIAGDTQPKEIIMHIPILAKEKGTQCVEVPSREELGAAAGLSVGTSAVVVLKVGDAKGIIDDMKTAETDDEVEEEVREATEPKAEPKKVVTNKEADVPEEPEE